MDKRTSFISRLDENVIATMLAVSIVACIILAFRNKSREACVPFTISTLKDQYRVGESITFETNAHAIKKLQWDFGDNRKDETVTGTAFHIYNEPNNYIVTLSTDQGCPPQYKMLRITAAPGPPPPPLIPVFQCPDTVEVDQIVHFKDLTPGATTWEWSFGETKTITIDATSSAPEYSYPTPGYKTVSLTINNDPLQHNEHNIYVKAKPVVTRNNGTGHTGIVLIPQNPTHPPLRSDSGDDPPPPPPPQPVDKRKIITPEELKSKLLLVADQKLTVSDFEQYIADGNLDIPLVLDNDSKVSNTTFAAFCQMLRNLRKAKKIKELNILEINKNEGNGITSLKIYFKEKGGLFR